MALGGFAGFWDPNLHPRGWHGRFIKKFKLAPWLTETLGKFKPRQFQTDGQAAQFAFNQPKKLGHDVAGMRRVHMDFDEAADHLRNNDIDPTTQKFIDAMEPHFEPAPPGGLILSRTFGPEALGMGPEHLNENDLQNGIVSHVGNTLQDAMYSPTHLGSNTNHGPGKITMSIAVPEGTRVAYSGGNPNDRGVFLDRNQKLLITRVYPDSEPGGPNSGWYMTAVAEPSGATSGSPVSVVEGRKGAGLSEAQREAKLGGPSVFRQAAEPPRGDSTGHQLNIPGQSTEPGPPQTPEQKAAAAPARAARKAAYQQARQAEEANGGIPQGATPPPQAPQPVTPTPSQGPPSGVGERTEPVHGPIGGTPTGGESASQIAARPPEPTPAAPEVAPQASSATFKQAFKDAGLQSPTAGAQRREFNNAYMGVTGGKKDPGDALRELDADIDHNKHLLTGPEGKVPHEELRANVQKQEKLADLIAQHFNEPRLHRTPTLPEQPAEAPAPAKKAFSSVKELTPEQRAHYDSLDQLGKTRYLARRRAGQEHGAAFEGAKGKAPAKAATRVAKAVPAPTKAAAPAAEKAPAPAKVGPRSTEDHVKALGGFESREEADKYLADVKGKELNDLAKHYSVPSGANTVAKKRDAIRDASVGNKVDSSAIKQMMEGQMATGEKKAPVKAVEKAAPEAPSATVKKAVPEAVPAPAKSTAAKVAKAAPAAKAVSEVQTRADEAGLPKTVTALRAQAREQKIRGFSTMNKEQLQRALLGEEVGTGGKLGPIAPEKLSGHIEAAATDQAARNLMEDHTVADLKALAKHNGVDLKGITRKDPIKDAIIKHIRGEGPGALRPEKPTESLTEQMNHNRILERGLHKEPDIRKIVDDVNGDDPDSLRSHRDDLEKIAEETKTSDPIKSRIAQEAADAMGMRAQQISGVEEAPAAKKAVKAVKKAAAPKLSVHQERVRKQHIADGMDEAEARRLAEEAPVRAPAGTKAATAKATAARKAAGLPTPREEGAPGPKLTAAKRAAKATPPAKEGVPEGPGRVQPQGVREAAAPGDLLSPESTRKLRAAGLEPGVPGKGRPGAPEAAARKAARLNKLGIPTEQEAKLKEAGIKPTKVVPEGSVKGERAQTPIDNQFRAHDFDAAYMKHVDKRTRVSDSAIESQDQIAGDISEGRITPEEGIRRIESEIAFNNDEIQNLSRDIRSGNLEGADLDRARSELNRLERDNASHESLSRDLHQHFGKEKVTVPEVKESIANRLGLNVGDMLKQTDAQRLKDVIHNDPSMAHLGEIKGNTGEEVFDNTIKAMITHRMNEIAAEKEGKKAAKVAKKAAPSAPRAKPAPNPDFAPGGAKHLDAKAIAGNNDIEPRIIQEAQDNLNNGMTPGQAAKRIEDGIAARRAMNVYQNGGWSHNKGEGVPGLPATSPERIAADKAKYDENVAKEDKVQEFADRLKATRRPIVRKAAAAKAAEDIAAAKEETPKGPARKALNQAEKSVKEAGDEAQALKARIVGRHRDAWDKSTTRGEAEAAAEGMRKDLLLSEIREFFGKDGITGRSKDDLLKKAIERRFGSGGDISPEVVKSNAARTAVNNRMEESARLKKTGGGFARLDEILTNGGSERAINHRVDNAGLNEADTERLRAAAHAGDRAELDRIAQEHGLTRNTGVPGHIEPFEPGKHRAITGSHRKGDAVRVIQPGYQGTVEGRAFQAHPATVLQATPEEKQGMLERLGRERNEVIKNLPAETRASVLARVHRQGQNPVAKKAAARARAAKGIAEPEPLPTNKEVEVAQNMERLNAAKAVKKAAPSAPAAAEAPKAPAAPAKAAAPAALPSRGPIKHANVQFNENTSPATFKREDGNTPLRAPNGSWSSDQGLIHMDSEIGQLWSDLAKDNRLPNSDLNKITVIGQDLGRGNITTKEAATELNGIRNGLTDGPVKDRFTEAVRGLDVKPSEYSVPDNTPKEVRDWLDHINAIPAFHNKAPNQVGSQGPTPFEKAVALVRDIGEGKQGPGGDMKLTQVAHNVHESGDGVYQARKEGDRLFFPGSSKMTPDVRNWIRSYRNKEQAPEAPKAPAKATKAAKKAGPAKVTQAELKNPVPKAGNAAPSATPSQVQASGLKAGEGIPTGPLLSARNKLGTGNAGTLTKLDTAVRIPARHGDIPGLLSDLQEQLQRAGVGPNDEPRKSLVAWFREHFK